MASCFSALKDDHLPQAKMLRLACCLSFGKKTEALWKVTRHLERNKVHYVATLPMRSKLLECVAKGGDT